MYSAPPAQSTVIDESAADQQIPDNNLTEGTATDMTPEKADDTMIDACVCFDIQQDLCSIDSATLQDNLVDMTHHATPSIEETIQAEFPASGPQVELYDELGNRITATLIPVIGDYLDISNNKTSPVDTIATTEVTSVLRTKGLHNFIYNKVMNENKSVT